MSAMYLCIQKIKKLKKVTCYVTSGCIRDFFEYNEIAINLEQVQPKGGPK